jgi:hypothetical protein
MGMTRELSELSQRRTSESTEVQGNVGPGFMCQATENCVSSFHLFRATKLPIFPGLITLNRVFSWRSVVRFALDKAAFLSTHVAF